MKTPLVYNPNQRYAIGWECAECGNEVESNTYYSDCCSAETVSFETLDETENQIE